MGCEIHRVLPAAGARLGSESCPFFFFFFFFFGRVFEGNCQVCRRILCCMWCWVFRQEAKDVCAELAICSLCWQNEP